MPSPSHGRGLHGRGMGGEPSGLHQAHVPDMDHHPQGASAPCPLPRQLLALLGGEQQAFACGARHQDMGDAVVVKQGRLIPHHAQVHRPIIVEGRVHSGHQSVDAHTYFTTGPRDAGSVDLTKALRTKT